MFWPFSYSSSHTFHILYVYIGGLVCACLSVFALLHAEQSFQQNKVSLVAMEGEMIALSRGGKISATVSDIQTLLLQPPTH